MIRYFKNNEWYKLSKMNTHMMIKSYIKCKFCFTVFVNETTS